MPPGLSAEVGGIDFLPDGRLFACFHRGEVYLYDPRDRSWKLFAIGLHDPLGIVAISDGKSSSCSGRNSPVLRDADGDGVADDYSTVTDGFGIDRNYHEFAFGPVRDKEGNFYVSLNVASSDAGIRSELRGQLKGGPGKPEGRMYSAVPGAAGC